MAVRGNHFSLTYSSARIQQTVDAQQFEDLRPRHFAALPAEAFALEDAQFEMAPEPGGRPSVAEAPRLAYQQGR